MLRCASRSHAKILAIAVSDPGTLRYGVRLEEGTTMSTLSIASMMSPTSIFSFRRFVLLSLLLLPAAGIARADETCMSPFMPKLSGQEDYVYVWTLGVEGLGDGSDKLVTVGANPT